MQFLYSVDQSEPPVAEPYGEVAPPSALQRVSHGVGVQVDTPETITLKGMYFQLVESQALSTPRVNPDVFNLHYCPTAKAQKSAYCASSSSSSSCEQGYIGIE